MSWVLAGLAMWLVGLTLVVGFVYVANAGKYPTNPASPDEELAIARARELLR